MSVSPQEKEKLRKRLQKLFEKENLKRPENDTSNQQPEVKKSKDGFHDSRNKKQQQNQPKGSKIPPLQNGFAKATGKQSVKSKDSSLKKDKPILQKKNNAAAIRANGEVPLKKQSQNNKADVLPKQKQVRGDKVPKISTKNKNFANKSGAKLEAPKVESREKKKSTKFKTAIKQNNATTNSRTKARKRAAISSTMDSAAVSNKKQKFIKKKDIQKHTKTSKKQKTIITDESNSSSQSENEYDVNHMPGYVPGGDFDSSDNESDDDYYFMKDENYSDIDSNEDSMKNDWEEVIESQTEVDSDDSSTKTSEDNTAMKKFKEHPKTDLKQFYHINHSESEEEDDFDGDSEFETECSDNESLLEHYVNSDCDEDDYEEEQDSYDYTSESDNEYFSDNDEYDTFMPYDYDHEDTDEDYELPKHIPEDLIVHKGTSSKRDLKPEDNISFDSDNDNLQIVELENQQSVKIIRQPKAYDKEELVKLKFEKKTSSSATFQNKKSIPNDDQDCPKLVPIRTEDGFQLYNPNEELEDHEEDIEDEEEGVEDEMEDDAEYEQESVNNDEGSMEEFEGDNMDEVSLGSEFTEIDSDDADSLLSEDINEKYMKRNIDSSDSDDDDMDENIWIKKHKPDVIDASDYKCTSTWVNCNDNSETSLNDDIVQIPSVNLYKNVDLKTECSILSTTIIDNEVHSSDDNSAGILGAKSNEAPEETEVVSSTQDDELKEHANSTDESRKAAKHFMQNIVNYNTKFFNAFNSNIVIVLLKEPFYIYGTVRLTLLAGSMEVYGHRLQINTEVEIFSPRGCSVIEISSLPTKNNFSKENLKELLQLYEKHFSLADLETIASLYNAETDAIVLLKRNDERKKLVQQYKKFMNENVFPNFNNINTDRPLHNTEYLLRCMINTSSQEQKCLRLPKDWQGFKLTSQSRVMLAGGKSVGKSTLLRYLINRHLPQKMLLIDLDIGQPEVFIPQTVSCTIIEQPLLGPGFLLNLQPEISFAVGHTNIVMCAHRYLSAVRSLLAYCREQEAFKDIPWLFNTMGYNKGFGLELISILAQESLTDVIQLQSSKEINNFETNLHAHALRNVPHVLFLEEYERITEEVKGNWNYRLHIWPSVVQQESRYQKEWEMSPKDLRFAMLLARLSQALQGHADWLTDVKPLSASLNDLKIINLVDNTPLAAAEELEKSLEANLVYLCHYEDEHKPLKCLGIGVVRAVDYHVRHLYLIPALPHTHLKDVNCLAIGDMTLPTSLFTNQGPRVKNIVPFVYNTVAASASKAIKQIYHRPAKFLSGKHKSLD